MSTVVAQFIDSTIFYVFAFAPIGLSGFELSWTSIVMVIAIGTALQLVLEALLIVGVAVHLTKFLKDKSLLNEKN